MALKFNPDNDPVLEADRLGAELEDIRAEWIASKKKNGGVADLDVKNRHQEAMDEVRTANMYWRVLGEAAGSRHFIDIKHNTP